MDAASGSRPGAAANSNLVQVSDSTENKRLQKNKIQKNKRLRLWVREWEKLRGGVDVKGSHLLGGTPMKISYEVPF
jgi:hypothetical protein